MMCCLYPEDEVLGVGIEGVVGAGVGEGVGERVGEEVGGGLASE